MIDIVERLRKVVGDLPPQHHVPLAKEAADEIERLRNDYEIQMRKTDVAQLECERLREEVALWKDRYEAQQTET